jgi:exodeoxyribonuclease VII small subunit
MSKKQAKFNFNQALLELEEINRWFQQEDIDLEEGLKKLKSGKELIAKCRSRLKEVENEFVEIQDDMEPAEKARPEPIEDQISSANSSDDSDDQDDEDDLNSAVELPF